MKLRTLLTLLSVVCLQSVQAQSLEPNLKWGKPTNEELTMTEYAPDKDAEAVVLCRQTDVSYHFMNGDFKVFYRIKARLKVLKPEGKSVADGSIVYYDNETNHTVKEMVSGLKATAYNLEDGKLVKTKMDRSMTGEERLDKYQKLLKFSVPQVKVGTVIEYEYRIESDYFYDLRDWHAQREIPVAYTSYEVAIPEWFKFNIEETGANPMERKTSTDPMTLVFGGATENISSNIWIFTGRNLPALKNDDYVWCSEDYGNKVTHELAGIYIPGAVHKSYTTTWDDIDKQLLDDDEFGGRLKKSSPLKAEIAAAGIPAIADKEARVAAVWQLLRSKVRWNGDYAFWGKSASKVLKEGTGTNADLNFLLINMLQDAGIESVPVVLRSRNRGILPLTHASMKYLSTFVVGIQLNDTTMKFLDGSVEDGYLNVLPSRLLVGRGRIVRKGAPGAWIDLQQSARGRETTSIQASLDADGLLKGTKNSMLVDEAAASLRRTWRQAKDSVEQIHKMQEHDGIEIESYSLSGRHDFSPVVKETMTFTKQCDATGDIIYVNPLVLAPISESPFTAAERHLPVEFPFVQSERLNVVLTLPEGYEVEELPKPMLIKHDGATARVMSSVNGRQVMTQYLLSIDRTFFAQAEYQDLKDFFAQLAECSKNILTIKKAE